MFAAPSSSENVQPAIISAAINLSVALPSDVDLRQHDEVRKQIPIEGISPEIVEAARKIAIQICGMGPTRNSAGAFLQLAENFAPQTAQRPDWQKVVALAGYMTTRISGEPYATKDTLPASFAGTGDALQIERAQTIIRFALVNRSGFDSAHKLEGLSNFTPLLKNVGLFNLLRYHIDGIFHLFELAFANEIAGDDPPVRLWKLDVPGKWLGPKGAALSARATAWMLRFGEKMVSKNDDGTFTFDLARMSNVIWSDVFERHGLRYIIEYEQAPFRNYRAVLSAGAALLGCHDLFGYGENQLNPEVLFPASRWKGSGAAAEREQLSQAVWKSLRAKIPQAFDESGKPIPAEIKKIRNWRDLLRTEQRIGYHRPFLTVRNFLQTGAPEMFGWAHSQIKPWELQGATGKWDGPAGEALFRSAFAYLLAHYGVGKLTLRGTRLDYDLCAGDIAEWRREIELNPDAISIKQHLSRNGLAGGLANAAGDSVRMALIKLFAPQSDHNSLQFTTKLPSMVAKKLLKMHGGALRIAVTELSPESATKLKQSDPSVQPSQLDPDMLLLRVHANPILHDRLAILTANDISLWLEAHVDPGRTAALKEGFFTNRSWEGTPMADIKSGTPQHLVLAKLHQALAERTGTTKIIPLTIEVFPDAHDLRILLDLVRLRLLDSINVQTHASSMLKEALLSITQSTLHPARIMQDCTMLQPKERSRTPSMLDLLAASLAFAVKVETAKSAKEPTS